MRMYSQQLVIIVKMVFVDSGWNYDFEEEYGAFRAGINLRCKLKSCDVIVLVGEEFIDSLAMINISVDEDKRNEVVEFITRVNYTIKYGNFDFDYKSGKIGFRLSVDCAGGTIPSKEEVKRAMTIPAILYERYGDGLLSVLSGLETPKEAVEKIGRLS